MDAGDIEVADSLSPLVEHWLALVRAGRERRPQQMDVVLRDMGPMPLATQPAQRAVWIAGTRSAHTSRLMYTHAAAGVRQCLCTSCYVW